MTTRETVRGFVLAGGESRRMQRAEKALLTFRGRPLLAHILERLSPQVDEIWLNVNRHHQQYRNFGLPLISDQAGHAGHGPLSGIQAGLSYGATRNPGWLLVCPCDSPFFPLTLAERLLNAAIESGQHAAVVHDGRRLHPVFCLLHNDLLPGLESHLQTRPGSVHAWLESVPATVVDFSDAPHEAFVNINTPEDLQQLEAWGSHV